MNIQSLSVVVPNKVCINHCATCPSRMHDNNYPMLIDENEQDFDLYFNDYLQRLEYARDNGCNVLMLTGTSEPQQNRKFLVWFGIMMKLMKNPFRNIEMQCTGALLNDEYLKFLRRHVGVVTMALSVFSLNHTQNKEIINPPVAVFNDVLDVSKMIKEAGMTLRICLNMTEFFDRYKWNPETLLEIMRDTYGANQLTFRVLYAGKEDCPENDYVRKHSAKPETIDAIRNYIKKAWNRFGTASLWRCTVCD